MTTEEIPGADAERWIRENLVEGAVDPVVWPSARPNARLFPDGSLEWYVKPPRMAVEEALAKIGVQIPPSPDRTFGGAKMPRASLEHLVSERTRDLPTVDISPMTRMVQAHAKKVVEHIDEALVRALQHTDHFEVHVYEWSTWGSEHEHRVVFNAAVRIVVKPDGGPEIIRHPYGEEPLHDERRD